MSYIIRPLISYNLPTRQAIKMMSISPDNMPVGSYIFANHWFPGDIDLREVTEFKESLDDALNDIIHKIKMIVNNLNKPNDDYYYSEFKAGFDPAFDIDVYKLDPKQLINKIYELYKNQIITNQDFYNLSDLLSISSMNEIYDELSNFFLVKKILRWTTEDIMRGYKNLSGNRHITLKQALQDPTIVKIDGYAWLNNRFVEISNFLILIIEDENGDKFFLNGEPEDRLTRLKEDVQIYLNKNPLKSMKRMWSIATSTGDDEMIRKINPILKGSQARLNQIKDDIDAILDMYEKIDYNFPSNQVLYEIDQMKTRMSYVLFDFPEEVYLLLNSIKSLNDIKKLKTVKNLIEKPLIENSLKFGLRRGILPPPPEYLP